VENVSVLSSSASRTWLLNRQSLSSYWETITTRDLPWRDVFIMHRQTDGRTDERTDTRRCSWSVDNLTRAHHAAAATRTCTPRCDWPALVADWQQLFTSSSFWSRDPRHLPAAAAAAAAAHNSRARYTRSSAISFLFPLLKRSHR